ncbi:flagellar basal body-associated FliL family protein [Stenotrophomonas tumulicola]|uniref:Flagellar protein FliL n=1 Tax=Stenotrophomonas tumulicola TaxID=1685415 RepID=A0A7W3II29_9GAMM|nr:flagellar basal body-associated FliL family protein [Stenotrophomonas tumulicola]
MATAADKTKKPADKDKAASPRHPLLVTALIAVLAAASAGSAAWYFTQAQHAGADGSTAAKPKARPAPAQYFALEPPFVVNLNGPADGPRYLQVEVQLMTRDNDALDAIRIHSPALRARLLMLFSQVAPEQIADRAGKEKLQAASLAEVRKVLLAETGKQCADELLFTSFVTQ